MLSYVASGQEEGARVLSGGHPWGTAGFWVEPTILVDVTPRMRVVNEEIFGPVVCVQKFTSEAQVLEAANASPYGLAAAVFTNDTRQATRVAHALDAGTVWVNQYGLVPPQAPFGGFKQSGIGRELGTYGIDAYTQVKAVHVNVGMDASWPA